jgi:hypothetical protein
MVYYLSAERYRLSASQKELFPTTQPIALRSEFSIFFPDGRRVYEFRLWGKKQSLVDTRIYNDLNIYSYLRRLKSEGENIMDYKTRWHCYG